MNYCFHCTEKATASVLRGTKEECNRTVTYVCAKHAAEIFLAEPDATVVNFKEV